MPAKESYCIVCGKEKDGIEIKEDNVIKSIRWFNRTVLKKPPRNNKLVVCKSCYPAYKERRKKYIGRQRIYIVLGALFVIMGVFFARSIQSVFFGFIILAVLYLLSLPNYTPDLDDRKPKIK